MAESVMFNYSGDKFKAQQMRGYTLSVLASLQQQMALTGLKQYQTFKSFADGTTVRIKSVFGIGMIDIYVPVNGGSQETVTVKSSYNGYIQLCIFHPVGSTTVYLYNPFKNTFVSPFDPLDVQFTYDGGLYPVSNILGLGSVTPINKVIRYYTSGYDPAFNFMWVSYLEGNDTATYGGCNGYVTAFVPRNKLNDIIGWVTIPRVYLGDASSWQLFRSAHTDIFHYYKFTGGKLVIDHDARTITRTTYTRTDINVASIEVKVFAVSTAGSVSVVSTTTTTDPNPSTDASFVWNNLYAGVHSYGFAPCYYDPYLRRFKLLYEATIVPQVNTITNNTYSSSTDGGGLTTTESAFSDNAIGETSEIYGPVNVRLREHLNGYSDWSQEVKQLAGGSTRVTCSGGGSIVYTNELEVMGGIFRAQTWKQTSITIEWPQYAPSNPYEFSPGGWYGCVSDNPSSGGSINTINNPYYRSISSGEVTNDGKRNLYCFMVDGSDNMKVVLNGTDITTQFLNKFIATFGYDPSANFVYAVTYMSGK